MGETAKRLQPDLRMDIRVGSHVNSRVADACDMRVQDALARMCWGPFLLASAHEGRRAAVLARSACACATNPPLICVAFKKGHWLGPIVRDSRRFAISLVGPDDKVVMRKFAEGAKLRDGDAMEWLPMAQFDASCPILAASSLAIACDVVRRIDLEADCELLVGAVTAAKCAQVYADGALLVQGHECNGVVGFPNLAKQSVQRHGSPKAD